MDSALFVVKRKRTFGRKENVVWLVFLDGNDVIRLVDNRK